MRTGGPGTDAVPSFPAHDHDRRPGKRNDPYVLDRREEVLATPYGEVRQKISSGYGAVRTKLEFEDLKKIALAEGISLAEAQALVRGSLPGEI